MNTHPCKSCAEDCDCGEKTTESCVGCAKCHELDENGEKRVIGQIVATKPSGFGFIVSPDIPFERIYFHWTGLRQNTLRFPMLKRGMKVEFQPQHRGERGYRALHIEVIGES